MFPVCKELSDSRIIVRDVARRYSRRKMCNSQFCSSLICILPAPIARGPLTFAMQIYNALACRADFSHEQYRTRHCHYVKTRVYSVQ